MNADTFTIYVNQQAIEVVHVSSHWNGSSGSQVVRTPDGAHWFACDYSGWDGPRFWYPIQPRETAGGRQ